jgi:hypothetical protein
MDEKDHLLIRGDKRRVLLGVAIGLSMLAACSFLTIVEPAPFWFVADATVGFVTVLWLGDLFRPATLELNPDGFAMRTAFSSVSYRWQDVKRFGVFGLGPCKIACFEMTSGRTSRHPLEVFNRALSGFDRTIPNEFKFRPRDLADLLSDWHARSGRNPARG